MKLLLSALVLGMSMSAFAQGDQEPCCNVISVDATTNYVTARDKVTGRLHQFKVDHLDIQSIKIKDAITIMDGRVTAIGGISREYPNVRRSYGEPCCTVVNVQMDPIEPCCGIITYTSQSTNAIYKFKAPKEVVNKLKVGDPVYAEPAGRPGTMTVANTGNRIPSGMVVVNAIEANSGEVSAYGFPITSGDGTTGSSTSNEKWKIAPNSIRGVTGRYVFRNLPNDAEWQLDVYLEPDNKWIKTFYSTSTEVNRHIVLSPGNYSIKLTHVAIDKVPVNKGHDTEIKFGMLNVVSGGDWHLYKGKTSLMTKYKPAKLALPPGEYRLNLGGSDYNVVIREGKTEEY